MELEEISPVLTRNEASRFSTLQKVQIGLIFAAYLFVGLNSGAFGVILPYLSASYGLDKSTTGLLFLTGAGGYVMAAFVSSALTLRLGLRYFIVAGMALYAVGSLTLGLQASFVLVLLARLLLGLAMATIETGGNFYVTALPRNTALLNYLHALFGAGALLGPLVATALVGWGWPTLFWLWFFFSLLLIGGFFAAFRKLPPSLELTPLHPDNPGAARLMWRTMRLPLVWWAVLFLLVYVGGESSVGNWTYTFLSQGQGLEAVIAGGMVSVYWLGLTLGRLAMGWATGWLHISDRTLLLSCVLGSAFGILLVWGGGKEPFVVAFGLLITGFCYGPIYPTTLALLSRKVAPAFVPSLISLLTSLSILGIALFPWLAGVLFDVAGLATFAPYVLGLAAMMLASGLVLLRKREPS